MVISRGARLRAIGGATPASESRDDAASKLLRRREFEHKRFAWPNPWGAALGWGEGEAMGRSWSA